MDVNWDELFCTYHHRIYTYMRQHALQPGDSDETAQDLASMVFVRGMEAVKRGNGPRSHVAGWLFTIARNLRYDHYRTRSHLPAFVHLDAIAFDDTDEGGSRARGDMLATDADTPHDHAARAILRQQVQHAIDRLTGQQPTVTRRRMEGAAYDEIAHELGKSIGAAKALNTRAFAQLRTHLDEVR